MIIKYLKQEAVLDKIYSAYTLQINLIIFNLCSKHKMDSLIAQ